MFNILRLYKSNKALRQLYTESQKTVRQQGEIIAELKSELSLRDGRIRHLEVALEHCRQKLKNALEKLGEEPPEHDLNPQPRLFRGLESQI